MWKYFVAWLRQFNKEPEQEPAQTSWSKHSLDVAIEILGWGEEGANNYGPEIDIIRRGRKLTKYQKGAWCASTCSYEIEEGWARYHGASSWETLPKSTRNLCPIKRTPSASGLARRISKVGTKVTEPLPGDFVLFKYKNNHHIAIVSKVDEDMWESIDGNRGRYNKKTGHGSKVRRYKHEHGEAAVVYFVRLPTNY